MSENFTPLQSPYSPVHTSSGLSRKQIAGAITTLGLLVAIGGGMLYVNRTQTNATKAFSTDQCVSQGGFEWATSCPPNTTDMGKIDSGQLDSGTGGLHACCVPNDKLQNTTQTGSQPSSPGGDGDQIQVTPPETLVTQTTCTMPKVDLTINCPNGCR